MLSNSKFTKKGLSDLWKNIWWSVREIFKLAGWEGIGYLVLPAVTSLNPLLVSFIFARILDAIVELREIFVSTGVVDPATMHLLAWLFGALLLDYYVNNAIGQLSRFLYDKFYYYYRGKFRHNLAIKVVSLDVAIFEDATISNKIVRVTENDWKFFDFINVLIRVLQKLLSMFVTSLILLQFSPVIVVLLLIAAIPKTLSESWFLENSWKIIRRLEETMKVWWSALWSLSEPDDFYEHKVTKSVSFIDSILKNTERKILQIRIGFRKKFVQRDFIATFIYDTIFLLAVIKLTVIFVLTNISVGDYQFYLNSLQQFASGIYAVFTGIVDMLNSSISVSELREVLNLQNSITSGSRKLSNKKPPKIEFKHVYFKYPNSDSFALKDISFVVNPGENIALVGHNGAGKTTIIKLLLRFYDVTKGQILINDVPIQEYDLESLRACFTALFQEFNRYNFATVEQNVMFDIKDRKRLIRALKRADAWDFVQELPYKERTKLHNRFKHGKNLSTGQYQKIAIARIFANSAPVFILDEPTASIDAMAEFKIFNNIYDYMAEKTVIIISHRFSTIRKAKRIFVIDNGRIVEEGTHKELLSKGGLYAKSYNVQVKELR